MKTSQLIDLLHKNDIDAIISPATLDFSIKYVRLSRGECTIELSYYSNWSCEQITNTPFPNFENEREAMMCMVRVIDKLKEDKK